jgi:8-oxo-dGTP pyrophosphatase MutT (NUDIX family)
MNNNNWNRNKTGYNTNWNYKKPKSRYSAGILPYSYDPKGNCIFLLGKDVNGCWSDFGGKCEFRDRDDEKQTASREFYEETLGSVMNISDCIEKISHGEPIKITSKTLNGSPYYMYLLYIDFKNYTEIFYKISNFLKYQQFEKNCLFEKVSIRWVNINTLFTCIDTKNEFKQFLLRGVFYNTLNDNKETLTFLCK